MSYLAECRSMELYIQVRSLLSPMYRSLRHMGVLSSYSLSSDDALHRLALVAQKLVPSAGGMTSPVTATESQLSESETKNKHPLLHSAVYPDGAEPVTGTSDLRTRVLE